MAADSQYRKLERAANQAAWSLVVGRGVSADDARHIGEWITMAWVEENHALGRPLDEPGTKQEMLDVIRRDMAEGPGQTPEGKALKARLGELGHAAEAAAMGVVQAPRDTFGYQALQASLTAEVARLAAGGPDERASAVFLRMHRGDLVFPGQPKPLRRKVRAGRQRGMGNVVGTVPLAFLDLVKHHGVFRDEETSACPTCKRIAAYVDVRGVGQTGVEGIIDDLVEEMRQKWTI